MGCTALKSRCLYAFKRVIYASYRSFFATYRKFTDKSLLILYYQEAGRNGDDVLKVEIKISPDIIESYAVIYSNSLTEEIQNVMSLLDSSRSIITVMDNERIIVLQPKEIFMVRVENEKTFIYCQSKRYFSNKRLYEFEAQLGKGFMRISKSTLINLKEISSVEPSTNGMMLLILRSGYKDYISRKYLPGFKRYLGL